MPMRRIIGIWLAVLYTLQPIAANAYLAPSLTGISGSRDVKVNELVTITGYRMDLVEEVLVDGLSASFYLESNGQLVFRVPALTEPGDANVELKGEFGNLVSNNLISVSALELPVDTKVTIGTFNGFVAVYTKNLEGHRISMQVGNTWRTIASAPANYTENLTKVGLNKIVTVMVYVDRVLVQVKQVIVR